MSEPADRWDSDPAPAAPAAPEAPEETGHDWTAGLPLSPQARERMKARVEAAAARKAGDREVKQAISGEQYGERDPQTGVFIRSHWYEVF
jgi:hypothetical protein